MMWRNGRDHYGWVTRSIHWVTAALMVSAYLLGEVVEDLDHYGAEDDLGFIAHASAGILVLGLGVMRLFWWPISGSQPRIEGAGWQWRLAIAVRLVLLFSLFALPLSGWMTANAEGASVQFFGVWILPNLSARGGEWLEEIHEALGVVFVWAVVLHALGALKHHFWDDDCTLKRMLSGRPCSD